MGIIKTWKTCHTKCWVLLPNCAKSGRGLKGYGLFTPEPTLLWVTCAGLGVHCRSSSQARTGLQLIYIFTSCTEVCTGQEGRDWKDHVILACDIINNLGHSWEQTNTYPSLLLIQANCRNVAKTDHPAAASWWQFFSQRQPPKIRDCLLKPGTFWSTYWTGTIKNHGILVVEHFWTLSYKTLRYKDKQKRVPTSSAVLKSKKALTASEGLIIVSPIQEWSHLWSGQGVQRLAGMLLEIEELYRQAAGVRQAL